MLLKAKCKQCNPDHKCGYHANEKAEEEYLHLEEALATKDSKKIEIADTAYNTALFEYYATSDGLDELTRQLKEAQDEGNNELSQLLMRIRRLALTSCHVCTQIYNRPLEYNERENIEASLATRFEFLRSRRHTGF